MDMWDWLVEMAHRRYVEVYDGMMYLFETLPQPWQIGVAMAATALAVLVVVKMRQNGVIFNTITFVVLLPVFGLIGIGAAHFALAALDPDSILHKEFPHHEWPEELRN